MSRGLILTLVFGFLKILQVQMVSKLAKSRMFDLARFLKIVKKKLFAPNLSGNFYEETFF